MSPFLEARLKEKYPLVWGRFDSTIRCGDGWYWVLDYLSHQLTLHQSDEALAIAPSRVAERSGELWFNAHNVSEQQNKVLLFARALSRNVCEVCGEPGRYELSLAAWPQARCDLHVDVPVTAEPTPRVVGSHESISTGQTIVPRQPVQPSWKPWKRPRLSRVCHPLDPDECAQIRDTSAEELALLCRGGYLSAQHTALIALAFAALKLASDVGELKMGLQDKVREVTRNRDVRSAAFSFLEAWAHKVNDTGGKNRK